MNICLHYKNRSIILWEISWNIYYFHHICIYLPSWIVNVCWIQLFITECPCPSSTRGCSTTTTNIQIWNINQTTKVTCICSVSDCVLSEYCVLSETVERVTAGPEDGSSIWLSILHIKYPRRSWVELSTKFRNYENDMMQKLKFKF